ncbi:hypothetical protein HYG86_09150 [Alkalicella caledoniensis]|uniref:Uncharacterized protein n=1 Tax=Alkalicella caledoniensis TaxID=2731377 RepID=A0A7G9W8B6_ALKCA|nr:hypothetical protein [Alkalicella caledoniensis]QNO14928.1 hypothetical protein HYG86_09150 [Alkalicella caledoniensis]
MAKKTEQKTDPAVKAEEIEISESEEVTKKVIVWQATKPLTQKEHEHLSNKLRFEQQKTGVEIILMPYTCKLGDGEDV